MRLALYAHYGSSPQVAGHVLFCLEHIAKLGFQICFISNSEISPASEVALGKICKHQNQAARLLREQVFEMERLRGIEASRAYYLGNGILTPIRQLKRMLRAK